MKHKTPENTPRVLLLALASWAIAAVVAALDGVFTRLSPAELASLGGFAFLFASLTAYVDAGVRDYLRGTRLRSLVAFAIEMDLGIAVGTMIALGLANGNVDAALTGFPLAVVIVFALPVAAVGHVLLAERLVRRAGFSSPVAKAPAGKPAGI